MRRNPTQRRKQSRKSPALLAGIAFLAAGSVHAATPAPLPPPAELLDGNGYAVGAAAPTYQIARPQTGGGTLPPFNPYNNYGQPRPELPEYDPYSAMPQLPPLPPPQAARAGQTPPARDPLSVPHMAPPPNTAFPPAPAFAPYPPPQPGQTFRVSGPAASMPPEYFNLPFMDESSIPGVLLPDLDPEFVDPGAPGLSGKRYIQPGMNPRQLEPFFELAKGFEKRALDFRKVDNDAGYRDSLAQAVAGYMEIIAMADASNEAREEAWYGVARCEYRRENYWRAFDALERSFPEQFVREEVAGRIRLEMFIGERLWRMGSAQVPDSRKNGELMTGYQAASRVYTAALFNQPNAADAPLAMLRRGDAMAMEENWEEAAKFYRSVVEYYPDSEPAMQARSSLTEAVYRQDWPAGFPEAARSDVARVMNDVERSDGALSGPAAERRRRAVALANDLEAENLLRTAKNYMNQIRVKKSQDAAVFQLGEIVSNYPDTAQAEEAAEILRGMGIEPPMRLSDGNRFPITPHWQPADMPARGEAVLGGGGGSARRERQERDVRQTEQPPRAASVAASAAAVPAPAPAPASAPVSEPEAAGNGFSRMRAPDPVEPYLPRGQPGFSAQDLNRR